MEGILPDDLSLEVRAAIRQAHREAWLLFHDPDMLQAVDQARPQNVPEGIRLEGALVEGGRLAAVRRVSRSAFLAGDYQGALSALRLLESLLTVRGLAALRPEELELLAGCLCDQSVCEGRLGNHEEAIQSARHAVAFYHRAGLAEGEAGAVHQLGLACAQAGRFEEACRYYADAREGYKRLGMVGEVIRARRDAAMSLVGLQRFAEAERELRSILAATSHLPPKYRYPTLVKLAHVAVARGDAQEARRWLIRADVYARDHAEELADHLQRHHVQEERQRLEQAVTDLCAGQTTQVADPGRSV